MDNKIKLEWELPHGNGKVSFWNTIAFAIQEATSNILHRQMPYLEDLFPLSDHRFEFTGHLFDSLIVTRIKSNKNLQFPHEKKLSPIEISNLEQAVIPFSDKNIDELTQLLGATWYSFNTFTYIGPFKEYKVSWPHIHHLLLAWLNKLVLPEVLERNKQRVLLALPPTPQFDIKQVMRNIYALETEETQGTCFHLRDVGLVTCDHVLRNEDNSISTNIKIYTSENTSVTYKAELIKSQNVIDIALLNALDMPLNDGFEPGQCDSLKQMDHIAVAGFPNYRLGDSGILSPGLVIGFRNVSGVRRVLVNTPIIAGNSGGPVLNAEGKVIGVAVTGADRMEEANQTENHGIVPIEAIALLP